jgi:hypothetical protein
MPIIKFQNSKITKLPVAARGLRRIRSKLDRFGVTIVPTNRVGTNHMPALCPFTLRSSIVAIKRGIMVLVCSSTAAF